MITAVSIPLNKLTVKGLLINRESHPAVRIL
jgi:hypothetical protein